MLMTAHFLKMKLPELRINERRCISCGTNTPNPLYCYDCYFKTPAGLVDRKREIMLQKYTRIEGGGECRCCVHWKHRCLLGIPEGGTRYAENCPARETVSVLE